MHPMGKARADKRVTSLIAQTVGTEYDVREMPASSLLRIDLGGLPAGVSALPLFATKVGAGAERRFGPMLLKKSWG